MKSKEEMIEAMARSITHVIWHKKQQYLRMSSNLYVDKYWINYIPEAEAALKALCRALPDETGGHESIDATYEHAENYNQLLQWGKDENQN